MADAQSWHDFLVSHPEGDVLQAWAWGDAAPAVDQRPLRIVATRTDGKVCGLAQALVRSGQFGQQILYVPHGPVWEREADDADAILQSLIDGLRAAARAERGLVVKLDPRAVPGNGSASEVTGRLTALGLRPARHDLQARTTRLVNLLDGGDELMNTWHPDARRLPRRAARQGVEVELHRDADDAAVDDFHDVLEATASRGGFRARPRTFLRELAAGFAEADAWYLVLARLRGRVIAGVAAPRLGDRGYCLYGGSLRGPAFAQTYGGYVALAATMRFAALEGVRSLDLWGVREPEDQTLDGSWEGFSAVKRRFGGDPVRHPGTFDLVTEPLWYALRDVRERVRDRFAEGRAERGGGRASEAPEDGGSALNAGLSGAVATAIALGMGELIAGLLIEAPSLVDAVGALVISRQPPGAKDFVVASSGKPTRLRSRHSSSWFRFWLGSGSGSPAVVPRGSPSRVLRSLASWGSSRR